MIRPGCRWMLGAYATAALTLSACGNAPSPAAAAAAAGAAAAPAAAESAAADRARAIAAVDSVVHEVLATGWVPGMSVAVMRGSDTLVLRGYGFADQARQIPMTAETVLPFGSILKQFTAAAILRLVEQGELRLDDSVTEFFPELPREWRPVTIHHLLNHTSGLPRALAPAWEGRERNTRAELLQELSERGALEFLPGERWVYNNAAFVVLALLVERRTGESYHEHIRRTLLEPLGMRSTGDSDAVAPGLPQAMGHDTVQGRLEQRPITGFRAALGAGFYHATAGDLLAWQHALRSGRIVRPETYAGMITPTALDNGDVRPYGYALWLRDLDGRPRVGHGGIQPGFRPFLGYLPEEDLTVVVLINSGAADPWAVGESIMRAVPAARAPEDE